MDIVKQYRDDPSGFKSAWLDENNPKSIRIDFIDFKQKVRPIGNENPKTNGWYEHSIKKKKFVLDTAVVAGKKYYTLGTLTYTDEDITDDNFSIKRSIQNGDKVDFIGCIATTVEFKVTNDFKLLLDQKLSVTLIVHEGNTDWEIKMFTGFVDEVKRDKSRDLVRTVTCHDFLYRLSDDYDVTDWYVWQYGDAEERTDLKHTVKELRDSFWEYISTSGTVYSPNGTAIQKKNEGWSQSDTGCINDSIQVPKTLNVSPVDFDEYISGELVGGPFKRNPKVKTEGSDETQYDVYENGIISGWPIENLVARKQIIELGAVGTLFTYTFSGTSHVDTNFREYMDHCDTNGSGIQATIKIPREEQEKLRETQISALTVLQAFCQINGVFGQFNGEGVFEYIKLDTSNPDEILEDYQQEVGYSDIAMPNITGVVIFDKTSEEYSADQVHTEYGDVKNGKKGSALAYYPDDRTKIDGDDAHVFTIEDNFLMNSLSQTDAIGIAKNLYDRIKNLDIRNCSLDIKAMPWFKCGETICYYAPTEDTLYPSEDLYPSENLYPSGEQKITTVIMSYDISNTGLFKGSITCEVEDISSSVASLNEIISSEIFFRKIGNEQVYSAIEQTAQRIQLQVVDEVNGVKSSITQLSDSIDLRIDGPDGIISRLTLAEDSISLQSEAILAEAQRIEFVANEQVDIKTRLLNVETDELQIKATKVSFEDLATGGKTTIDGANIKTGTLSANRIALGSVTLDGETYDMQWRKALIVDTKYGMQAHKLGVTVKPDNKTTTLYLNYSKNADGYVTDIWINENHTGTYNQAIGNFVLGSNLLASGTSSESGNCAWGTTSSADSNLNAYWYGLGSDSTTGYRLILASENRAH